MGESYSMHGGDEKYTQNFCRKNLKERDHSEDLGVEGNIIFVWNLDKQGGKVWAGFMLHRIRTSCGLL
jgi:hypothetical protein